MIILGIESSCDETAAAVLQKDKSGIHILSNVVASSASLQAKYGGIIPEQAAREQLKAMIPVIEEALRLALPKSRLPRPFGARNDKLGIDAIAVTFGPGLIGSLLVGVETAKTLSLVWDKPLIPVNHLIGHFYANWISSVVLNPKGEGSSKVGQSIEVEDSSLVARNDKFQTPSFPCVGLLVSGGHTDLVLFTDHGKYEYLGGTRDDAAGECFDKCARLLGLPYPGGPGISKLASQGDALRFNLPRPMIDSKDFDFSFSGLKTAVANLIKENLDVIPPKEGISTDKLLYRSQVKPGTTEEKDPDIRRGDKVMADLAAAIEKAIVDVLVAKTIRAAQMHKVDQIMIAGGVAANKKLINDLRLKINNLGTKMNYSAVNCGVSPRESSFQAIHPRSRAARYSGSKIKLHVPPPQLCTDNAAMIASAAFFLKPVKDPLTIQADPSLALLY
ncbi:tRNA (adenosine(37)-N6)-threonylcarbamoyltransferase complex transferase subunit TsaD [Candidatus Daviesbacteria bacterium]|nr:tRNA (adenosine(37)-N6)-threonylcarbamoyltransferase complex transferase subunit TsaD [Candidatus Daviesbacteria bacterium]